MVKNHFCIITAQDTLFKVATFIFVYCIQNSTEEPDVCRNKRTELYPMLNSHYFEAQCLIFVIYLKSTGTYVLIQSYTASCIHIHRNIK